MPGPSPQLTMSEKGTPRTQDNPPNRNPQCPKRDFFRRCGVCDKIFDREDKMQAHQATHSRAGDGDYVRPYPCNFPGCGKAFTEKRNLNAHRRTQHTEVSRVGRGHPMAEGRVEGGSDAAYVAEGVHSSQAA